MNFTYKIPYIFVSMLNRIIPLTVWHSQPFEVPVLDAGMRWALVRYRNPREQPRKFLLMSNLFVVRNGQSFGAVGNEACTSIRVWQFRWWLGWPKPKRIGLTVRKLIARRMPDLITNTSMPRVVQQIAHDLHCAAIPMENTPNIALDVHVRSSLKIHSNHFQLEPFKEEPNLKTFSDSI